MNIVDIHLPFRDQQLGRRGHFYRHLIKLVNGTNFGSCREVFLRIWPEHEDVIFMGYAHNLDGDPDRVVRFVRMAEDRLGLRQRTHFNLAHILTPMGETWIIQCYVPWWWRQSILRRGIYTGLLRSGLSTSRPNDFHEGLNASTYFVGTMPALYKFLSGCTALGVVYLYGGYQFTGGANWKFHMSNATNWKYLINPQEQQIREKAHSIWEHWGRPCGRDSEIWEEAVKQTPKD